MKLIAFDDDGNVILPTYDQVARDSLRNSVWGVKGLDELEDIMREKGIDIRNLLILPLISNPTFDDSDYDGIYDMYDEEPVMNSSTDLDVGIIDDTNIFDNGTMTDIRIDENGVFNYENLNGSTTVKKTTVTYKRYADSEKRSLTKFRLLYSGHYSDFKLSVETKYDNDVERDEFIMITQNCIEKTDRYNVNLSLHNYDIIDSTGERYDCRNWNNGYISKYYYTGSNGNYRIIRTNEISTF